MDNITDTDILEDIKDDRFEFWTTADREATLQNFTSIEAALIDLRDMDASQAFTPGECSIRDLQSGQTWDVVDFLATN